MSINTNIFVVVGVGRRFSGPTVYHTSMMSANREAKRLAAKFPGCNFLVCVVAGNLKASVIQEEPASDGLRIARADVSYNY